MSENTRSAIAEIMAEVERAVAKFPTWPTDPLHAVAVLGEEFGELTKEALQLVYEPHKTSADEVRKEALQTAAMAIRFYRSLDQYEYKRGAQHIQRVDPAEEVSFTRSAIAPKHWVYAAAEAHRTFVLGMSKTSGDNGSLHLLKMLDQIKAGMSPTKACRWLGWIQASLAASGDMTLDELKAINKNASTTDRTAK